MDSYKELIDIICDTNERVKRLEELLLSQGIIVPPGSEVPVINRLRLYAEKYTYQSPMNFTTNQEIERRLMPVLGVANMRIMGKILVQEGYKAGRQMINHKRHSGFYLRIKGVAQ